MEVMFERVAGLDVGKASVTVCVRTPSARAGRRKSETRTFPTMSRSLDVLRDWLVAEGVTVAAIYCLEEVMDVWLLNAQHMKAVPGRKTDLCGTRSGSLSCSSTACCDRRSCPRRTSAGYGC